MLVVRGLFLASVVLAASVSAQKPAPSVQTENALIESRTVATSLAARLEADFVYPEQGSRYAEMLRANAGAGAYDNLSGAHLAERLTADVQAVAPDGHLRVQYGGAAGAATQPVIIRRTPGTGDGAGPTGPTPIRIAPPPPIEHAGWIAPGIAFVRFNLFPGDPATVEGASNFMATHADARAIIFDIRTHRGGGPDEMDAIFSWLFAEPTRLIAMATRQSVEEREGPPVTDGPTMRRSTGDPDFITREHWAVPGTDRRLNNARVFVLTSGYSASAAEHFALAFKATGRGTLIGATTRGANHFGGDQDLGGGFTAFIPVGRAYDPATGQDWEDVGIAPDIETSPEDALIRALTLSGVAPDRAAQLSAQVAPTTPMVVRR